VWGGESALLVLAVVLGIVKGSPFPAALIGAGVAAIRLSGLGLGLQAGRARGRSAAASVGLTLAFGILFWGRPPRPARGNRRTPGGLREGTEKSGPCVDGKAGV
jgi:hypothetical protein